MAFEAIMKSPSQPHKPAASAARCRYGIRCDRRSGFWYSSPYRPERFCIPVSTKFETLRRVNQLLLPNSPLPIECQEWNSGDGQRLT